MSKKITAEIYIENSIEVSTNIGRMPIAEYADVKAFECGFEGYMDLLKQGYFLTLPENVNE